MKNMIKAQLYQIVHTRVYYIVFITIIIIAGFFGAVDCLNGANSLEEWQKLSASDYATRLDTIVTFSLMAIAFFVSFFCADDFTDKTANHEIMSGRSRLGAYMARAVISVVFSIVYGLLVVSVSLGVSVIMTGWGDTVPVSAVIKRILLLAFPLFRSSCLIVMLSYFIKRPALAFLSFYGILSFMSIVKAADDDSGVLTVFSTINNIIKYNEWHIFGLESGVEIVYSPMPDTGFIVRCIFVSIAMGILYLIIGYNYFHRDDLE